MVVQLVVLYHSPRQNPSNAKKHYSDTQDGGISIAIDGMLVCSIVTPMLIYSGEALWYHRDEDSDARARLCG